MSKGANRGGKGSADRNQSPQDSADELDSKTKRKAHMAHLQKVGEALVALRPDQLAGFQLDDGLLEAIEQAQRIKSREALRRQKQYIGKLMRRADTEAIEARLAELVDHQSTYTAAFHELETLRDALVAGTKGDGGKDALGDVIARFPAVDKQKLRQLTKRAQREVSESPENKAARRVLFKFLRETMEQAEQEAMLHEAELDDAEDYS